MAHERDGEVTTFLDELVTLGQHEHAAILRRLAGGPHRFNDLVEALPELGDATIGSGLRQLDDAGLVVRRVEPGPPLRVLYELTPSGGSLAPTLVALKRWTAQR